VKNHLYIYFFVMVTTFCGDYSYALDEDFFGKSKSSNFYVSPVVNLIISGTDERHVSEILQNTVRLSKRVPVRNILILHRGKGIERLSYSPEMTDQSSEVLEKLNIEIPKNPYSKYFRELGLFSAGIKSHQTILQRLKISYSPTWVVRFEGKDYIYEGYSDISRFFSSDGSFVP
jgi:hypothetical protein